jgi:hypothetical protein
MLLNDIGKTPDITFIKINRYLEENYGIKISKDCEISELSVIAEKIEGEVVDLKLRGEDAKHSAEISKRLLILEAVKTLQESMMIKSPDFDKVISGMADFVCDSFCLSGTNEGDFDTCLKDAMNHYRSSKYRFPDDMVESLVKEKAMAKVHEKYMSEGAYDESANFNEDLVGDDLSRMARRPAQSKPTLATVTTNAKNKEQESLSLTPLDALDPWEKQKQMRMKGIYNGDKSTIGSELEFKLDDKSDASKLELEPKSMSYGKAVKGSSDDPFVKYAERRKAGIYYPPTKESNTMNEKQSLIKNLRRLLENEVSQADVLMSSREFALDMQEMIEKIGRMQNEHLPPVTDRMREIYGTENASIFQTRIYAALQGVMDALYTAKNEVDDVVTNLATTGSISSTVDMEKDFGPEGMGAEAGQELGAEVGAEAGEELGQEMGTDMDVEAGLGREPKAESIKNLKNKIVEMQKLVDRAKRLKEMKKSK